MKRFTWRDEIAPIIDQAVTEGREKGLTGKDLERFVSRRYPFGERASFPYKVWLNEFARQVRGQRKLMNPPRRVRERHAARARGAAGQGRLFDELPPPETEVIDPPKRRKRPPRPAQGEASDSSSQERASEPGERSQAV